MGVNEAKTAILENRTALGIEFGSTRIKAVLVDDKKSADRIRRLRMGEPVCGRNLDLQPGGDLEGPSGQLSGYGKKMSGRNTAWN